MKESEKFFTNLTVGAEIYYHLKNKTENIKVAYC